MYFFSNLSYLNKMFSQNKKTGDITNVAKANFFSPG